MTDWWTNTLCSYDLELRYAPAILGRYSCEDEQADGVGDVVLSNLRSMHIIGSSNNSHLKEQLIHSTQIDHNKDSLQNKDCRVILSAEMLSNGYYLVANRSEIVI
jgi:hypothetical protein